MKTNELVLPPLNSTENRGLSEIKLVSSWSYYLNMAATVKNHPYIE